MKMFKTYLFITLLLAPLISEAWYPGKHLIVRPTLRLAGKTPRVAVQGSRRVVRAGLNVGEAAVDIGATGIAIGVGATVATGAALNGRRAFRRARNAGDAYYPHDYAGQYHDENCSNRPLGRTTTVNTDFGNGRQVQRQWQRGRLTDTTVLRRNGSVKRRQINGQNDCQTHPYYASNNSRHHRKNQNIGNARKAKRNARKNGAAEYY